MKKLFSLLFVTLLALSASGKIVTIDFSQLYNADTDLTTITEQGITLTFDKNGGTQPKYYANGTSARIYNKNIMTVAAETNYIITSIDFTYSQNAWVDSCVNVGTVINGDWTGSANSIVFSNTTGGQIRMKSMTITVVGGETPADKVADPVFNPNGGTYPIGTSLEVTVECATPKSNISLFKVTEDGEEYVDWFFPNTGGDEDPTQGIFYVTESGKYGAIAYKGGMTESDTTFVTFTFIKPTCAKPTFTPPTGTTFLEGEMITVTINCATEGATITYTVNDNIFEGTAPVQVPIDMTATITAVASKENYNDSEEATATYTMVTPVAEGPVFTLVNDVNELAAGDKIIFVNSKEDGSAVAMAGTRGNNFGGVNVVVENSQVQTNEANVITLEQNGGTWNFKTADGYLYAAGGNSSNWLKTETTVDGDGNANALITINDSTYSIVFQGTSGRNHVRYNPNNGTPIFSCYASTSSQGLVYIYKTVEEIIDVASPTFTPAPNSNFTGSLDVTIACETPNAVIYYSLDGENFEEYTGAINITETTTVYAYAKVGDSQSTTVSAKYYKNNEVGTIAEALALESGNTDFVFNGEAIVTYQNGINTWIKDASGCGLIYGEVPAMVQGTVIEDGWTAYVKDYYGVPEFANPQNVNPSEDVVTVEPEEKETLTTDDVNMYIIMKNQALVADTVANTWLNADGLKFYDKFGVTPTIEEGKNYDVVGIATIFKNAPEVYIISVTEVQSSFLRGDVDNSGDVKIGDVTALINYLLSGNAEGINLQAADCDQNGEIKIADVTTLINYLLSGVWND